MMPRLRMTCLLLLFAALALAVSACNRPVGAFPRPEVPIYRPPSGPSASATLSPTLDAAEPLQTGEELSLPRAGFAFTPLTAFGTPPQALVLTIHETRAELISADESLFFSLAGELAAGEDSAACLERILSAMRSDSAMLQAQGTKELSLAGQSGLAAGVSTEMFGQAAVGQVSVLATQGRCFSLIGLAVPQGSAAAGGTEMPQADGTPTLAPTGVGSDAAGGIWDALGLAIQNKLLASVHFLPSDGLCLQSSEPTYGYSADDPIAVGSQALYDGRTREETYLATLRGPQGEEVFFSRLDPRYNAADTIVDPYEISYTGLAAPLTLYFDIYHYETLRAPSGLSCEADFPLFQP